MSINKIITTLVLCMCFSLSCHCLGNNRYGDYYKEDILKSNGISKYDEYIEVNKNLNNKNSGFSRMNDLKQHDDKKIKENVNFNDLLQSENLMIDD